MGNEIDPCLISLMEIKLNMPIYNKLHLIPLLRYCFISASFNIKNIMKITIFSKSLDQKHFNITNWVNSFRVINPIKTMKCVHIIGWFIYADI